MAVENIINAYVKLSQNNTTATVEWTSGQSGFYGYVYYAQGYPNNANLAYSSISVGPTSVPQNLFSVVITGLNPKLPYTFYVETVLADDATVVAQMQTPAYLLNPLLPSGTVPVSGGYPTMAPLTLGANQAIDLTQGDVPNMAEALDSWYQYLTVEKVGKVINDGTAFQIIETTVQIPFRGIIVPERAWEMSLKPVGQRTWKFYKLLADIALPLYTDDVILWQGNQYRVVSLTDWAVYGYYEYSIAQDWYVRGPIS